MRSGHVLSLQPHQVLVVTTTRTPHLLPGEELDARRYLPLFLTSLQHRLFPRPPSVAAVGSVFQRTSAGRIHGWRDAKQFFYYDVVLRYNLYTACLLPCLHPRPPTPAGIDDVSRRASASVEPADWCRGYGGRATSRGRSRTPLSPSTHLRSCTKKGDRL